MDLGYLKEIIEVMGFNDQDGIFELHFQEIPDLGLSVKFTLVPGSGPEAGSPQGDVADHYVVKDESRNTFLSIDLKQDSRIAWTSVNRAASFDKETATKFWEMVTAGDLASTFTVVPLREVLPR